MDNGSGYVQHWKQAFRPDVKSPSGWPPPRNLGFVYLRSAKKNHGFLRELLRCSCLSTWNPGCYPLAWCRDVLQAHGRWIYSNSVTGVLSPVNCLVAVLFLGLLLRQPAPHSKPSRLDSRLTAQHACSVLDSRSPAWCCPSGAPSSGLGKNQKKSLNLPTERKIWARGTLGGASETSRSG